MFDTYRETLAIVGSCYSLLSSGLCHSKYDKALRGNRAARNYIWHIVKTSVPG